VSVSRRGQGRVVIYDQIFTQEFISNHFEHSVDELHLQIPIVYLVRNVAIDLDSGVSSNITVGVVRHQSNLAVPRSCWARIRKGKGLSGGHLSEQITSMIT
jgi:hypothetical protein